MIFEKNCLFFYPKDLMSDYYKIDIKDVSLSMFLKPEIDREILSKNISQAKIILYVDDKRQYKHLEGKRKGKIETY